MYAEFHEPTYCIKNNYCIVYSLFNFSFSELVTKNHLLFLSTERMRIMVQSQYKCYSWKGCQFLVHVCLHDRVYCAQSVSKFPSKVTQFFKWPYHYWKLLQAHCPSQPCKIWGLLLLCWCRFSSSGIWLCSQVKQAKSLYL